jgi:hypothetical protein
MRKAPDSLETRFIDDWSVFALDYHPMKKPAQETRQHILDVAKALMTQKGYTAVGLAEVVAAAGVPKGSFYYYFKSRKSSARPCCRSTSTSTWPRSTRSWRRPIPPSRG